MRNRGRLVSDSFFLLLFFFFSAPLAWYCQYREEGRWGERERGREETTKSVLNVGRCLREKEEEREGRENAIGKGTEVEEEKSKYWEKVEGGCLLLEVFFLL